MKKGGGILAILAGGPKGKPKDKASEDDYGDDELDDLDESGDDEADDLDLDEEGEGLDEEKREVCDRLFDSLEARDHDGFWAALGDAVDMVRGV